VHAAGGHGGDSGVGAGGPHAAQFTSKTTNGGNASGVVSKFTRITQNAMRFQTRVKKIILQFHKETEKTIFQQKNDFAIS
jgi:hypothetical protein